MSLKPQRRTSSTTPTTAMAPLPLLLLLSLLTLPSTPMAVASSSPFDAALATLQKQIGYEFRASDLLRRAMTHPSYSAENGRGLALLGLSAAEAAAALRLLAADHDATAAAVAGRVRDAAGVATCAAAGARLGLPAVVRVAARTNASAAPVVCGALRALLGAVAVDAGGTDAAGEVFWRVHKLTSSSAAAAM